MTGTHCSNWRLLAMDFDGVLTDNTVYIDQDGREMVRCWRGDGVGLTKLQRAGVKCVIISQEANPVVAARAQKMGIEAYTDVIDKLSCLETVAIGLGIDLKEVVYMGNDESDIPCLMAVGLGIVVSDAHESLKNLYLEHRSIWTTTCRGGCGAVREVCDHILERLSGD